MTEVEIASSRSDLERAILVVAPEQEILDWIWYRVRGGADPLSDGTAGPVPETAKRPRPEREELERALSQLVDFGMLTYHARRWSMTAKGFAAI
jgi:hypothetical protein